MGIPLDGELDGDYDAFLTGYTIPEPQIPVIDLYKSSLELSTGTILADGVETAVATATIRDSSGDPVNGIEVILESNGTGVVIEQTNSVTDENGQVVAQISSTTPQTIMVSARYVPVEVIIQAQSELLIDIWQISSANSSITAAPQIVLADGESTSIVTVTVKDINNNVVEDIPVQITTSGSAVVGQTETQTDENGQITATIHDDRVETVTVSALVNGSSLGKMVYVSFQGTDLSAILSGPSNSAPGNHDTYTVGVKNNGGLTAQDVFVRLTLPSDLIFIDHSSPVEPTEDENSYEWELGTLAGGQKVEFTVTAMVDANTSTNQTIQTQVDVSTSTVEPNSLNNNRVVSTQILPAYAIPAQLNPTTQSIGIGDSATYTLDIQNTGFYPATFEVSQTGLDASWVDIDPGTITLLPGQSTIIPIIVSVSDCQAAGDYPFTVDVSVSGHPELDSEFEAELSLSQNPLVIINSPGQGITSGSRTVSFSWRTSPETYGVLTYYYWDGGNQILSEIESGDDTDLFVNHAVQATNLIRNQEYTWLIEATSLCGATTTAERTFTVGNGIVFDNHSQTYNIDRDYNQIRNVLVRNEDDTEAHTLTVTLANPYEDLISNFVGSGSDDETITLNPLEERYVQLAFHAQDTVLDDYDLTATITADEGGVQLIDHAAIRAHILKDFEVSIQEVTSESVTGMRTYRLTNTGDRPITDLKITLTDPTSGEPAHAFMQPQVDHGYLLPNASLQIKVVPLYGEEDLGLGSANPQVQLVAYRASTANQSSLPIDLIVAGSGQSTSQTIDGGCEMARSMRSFARQLAPSNQKMIGIAPIARTFRCRSKSHISSRLPTWHPWIYRSN